MRESQRGGPGGAIAVVLLVAAVLGAGAWFGRDLFLGAPLTAPSSSSVSSSTDETPSEEGTPPTEGSPSVPDVSLNVADCREAWQLQAAARGAASVVLTEWDAHLDIMNDLQAGKIDLATAKAKWPSTTKAAPAHIAAFHDADEAYTAAGKKCAAPEGSTAPEAPALATCAKNLSVGDGVLVKARAAVEPWETHLKDQSHFKAGALSAAKAEALWQSLWKQGVRLNPPYFAAAIAGEKLGCSLHG